MLKKKTLWSLLMIAAMTLFAGTMTTYAEETEAAEEELLDIDAEEELTADETSKVITVGEASLQDTEEIAEEESLEQTDSSEDSHTHSDLQSLGIFRTTGYCPCYRCSEGWGRRTSTGATATSGHTVAVDPRVIPYGTKLMIEGVIYTAEDRGGGVKGNHIDIFFDSHTQTRQHGSRQQEVFLVS